MIVTAAIGGLLGALLGTRCNVYALVPLHLLATTAVATNMAVGSIAPSHAVLILVAFSLCSNVGYVATALARTLAVMRQRARLSARRVF